MKSEWCIAKGEDAAFVAAMEDILDLYCLTYDESIPVICMDEKPYQFLDEVRDPIPMKPGKPRKVDSEYIRKGTCSIFVFTEPLTGWAYAHARERRTKAGRSGSNREEGVLMGSTFVGVPRQRISGEERDSLKKRVAGQMAISGKRKGVVTKGYLPRNPLENVPKK